MKPEFGHPEWKSMAMREIRRHKAQSQRDALRTERDEWIKSMTGLLIRDVPGDVLVKAKTTRLASATLDFLEPCDRGDCAGKWTWFRKAFKAARNHALENGSRK